ncbi:MAG: prepilin-type N-terminal cleavage/methylation domain-containing protein [Myxococcales bacterium]|nr:prepilin-type N-terminal cleavage/methylation domain-containing protein [Myxococcales bacterium]
MTARAPSCRTARAGLGARAARGMTVLEIMIVLAIIGLLAYLGYSGFRVLSSQALTRDTLDLAAVMRRTQMLAMESATPVRLVIDLDTQQYWVEACLGDPTLTRAKEEVATSPEAAAKALEEAQGRLATLPAGQLKVESAEEATKMAMALAGRDVGGKVCYPVDKLPAELAEKLGEVRSFDSVGRDLRRAINRDRGVKVREVWVQHLEESVTGGQVSISFFPMGWAEKAIITLGDGRATYAIYLYGLTGRVEIKDGEPRNPNDHLLRDAKGEDEAER